MPYDDDDLARYMAETLARIEAEEEEEERQGIAPWQIEKRSQEAAQADLLAKLPQWAQVGMRVQVHTMVRGVRLIPIPVGTVGGVQRHEIGLVWVAFAFPLVDADGVRWRGDKHNPERNKTVIGYSLTEIGECASKPDRKRKDHKPV